MSEFITELNIIVHNCALGSCITVKEDGEGLDVIEIVFTPDGEGAPITFPWVQTDMARELASALVKVADHIDARTGKR